MARIIETDQTPSRRGSYTAANAVYVIFGILEALLLFRFVFLLLGANRGSGFVNFIYGITDPFVAPFDGIFGQVSATGTVTASVLDPATIIAIAVYGLIGWVIVRLLAPRPPADPVV